MAKTSAGTATAKKSAVKKSAKKAAPKKSAKKSAAKKATKKVNDSEEVAVEKTTAPRPASAKMAVNKEKSIRNHKEKVWDTLNVPRDRRGENLHEQNPDLQASINSRTVRDLDKTIV